ncbi:FxLD family lanthipeptide [Streptomyces sp. NRRL B-24572]|nr:FxLD family lanthipeptide [Streptomyces sp. NRRL B-24572]
MTSLPTATVSDPFDLDVRVVDQTPAADIDGSSDGGCMATCGNSCVSAA